MVGIIFKMLTLAFVTKSYPLKKTYIVCVFTTSDEVGYVMIAFPCQYLLPDQEAIAT